MPQRPSQRSILKYVPQWPSRRDNLEYVPQRPSQRGSGYLTSVGEERANLYAVVYLKLCGFCLDRFPLPLGAWDVLRYFILALPEHSINYFGILLFSYWNTPHCVLSLQRNTRVRNQNRKDYSIILSKIDENGNKQLTID